MEQIKNIPNITFKVSNKLANLLQLNNYLDYSLQYNYTEKQINNNYKRVFHKKNSRRFSIKFDYQNIIIFNNNILIFKDNNISLFTLTRIFGEFYCPNNYLKIDEKFIIEYNQKSGCFHVSKVGTLRHEENTNGYSTICKAISNEKQHRFCWSVQNLWTNRSPTLLEVKNLFKFFLMTQSGKIPEDIIYGD